MIRCLAPNRRGAVPKDGATVAWFDRELAGCSFWEAVARNRFARRRRRELPRKVAEERWAVALKTQDPMLLIDLRRDGPIRIAAPTAVAHDTNHVAGRTLSAAA